jgi:hypothetical protein
VSVELTTAFPFVQWEDFPRHMQWKQGEHATLIAPTGQGKTTLIREILPSSTAVREYVMVLVTKKRDDTLSAFEDYKKMNSPEPWAKKVMIYPPFPRNPDKMFELHRDIFKNALVTAYRQEGWTVIADEVRYLSEQLRLDRYLELIWLQGRSLGVTLVASTQRPRHIPLSAYDQATHLFLWRDNDKGNIGRLAEIGGTVDRRRIIERIPDLPRHQFIYVNTRSGETVESRVSL